MIYIEQQIQLLLQRISKCEAALKIKAASSAGEGKWKVRRIQEEVAMYYGIHVNEMLGASRRAEVAWPRQVAIYIAKKTTGLTSVSLGGLFSRDHSLILHSMKAVENQCATDLQKARQVEHFKAVFAFEPPEI